MPLSLPLPGTAMSAGDPNLTVPSIALDASKEIPATESMARSQFAGNLGLAIVSDVGVPLIHGPVAVNLGTDTYNLMKFRQINHEGR